MRYERIICYLVAISSYLFSGIFDNATIYGAASVVTPYLNGNIQVEDDYVYNIGIRKIALFPYQKGSRFYKGNEKALSDKALFGASKGLEYSLSASFSNSNLLSASVVGGMDTGSIRFEALNVE